MEPTGQPPTACLDIDLVPDIRGEQAIDAKPGEGGAIVLVRVHGQPLGSIRVEPGTELSRADLLRRLDFRARAQVTAHLVADGVAAASVRTDAETVAALEQVAGAACFSAPSRTEGLVSVVVCTLGREPLLEQCLTRLVEQDHPDVEIVVVDNDPSSPRVAELVASIGDARLRYVAEPLRGLSFARNAGLAASRGCIVAFTDDDAVPDVGWVSSLRSVFAESDVVEAVTGLVVPMELETPAQHWFEEFASFDKGYRRRVWHTRKTHRGLGALGDRGEGGPAFPFAAGNVGSGNNMAFRRETLERIGGFDVALGAGTPSGGGEDLDAFVEVLLGGGVIVYEPNAVVRHRHRRQLADLESQARAYGSGLSAMLAKQTVASPAIAAGVAVRVPAGLRRLLDPASDKNARKTEDFPPHLAAIERRGFAEGPWLYVQGRRNAREARRAADATGALTGIPTPPSTVVSVVDVESLPEALEVGASAESAWVVVRKGGRPRAMVETSIDPAVPLRTALAPTLDGLDRDGAHADPAPSMRAAAVSAEELPFVSVVVPTIVGRDADLPLCLDSLGALDYPRYEVVLVDNRPELPAEDSLPRFVADRPYVRVVREPVPGISAARNAGVAAARGEVIAFTDDDVRVDPAWLTGLGARFAAHPEEQAVTGLILPAELETPAQLWFEHYYGGFGGERTFEPLSFGVEGDRRLPWERSTVVMRDERGREIRRFAVYGAGVCGAGANMAFRRDWLLAHGGFDVSLGTGTKSRGGEDLAAVIGVLWNGGRVGYEPAAVVHHRHRSSYGELRHQMRGYGVGYTAMLTSLIARDPSHALGLGAQLPKAAARMARTSVVRLSGRRPDGLSEPVGDEVGPSYPPELARLELSGYPRGPLAYVSSRRNDRRRRG